MARNLVWPGAVVLGAVAGAVGGALAGGWMAGREGSGKRGVSEARPAALDAPDSGDLARVERRLDEIAAAVLSMDSGPTAPGMAAPGADGASTATDGKAAGSLAERLAAVEARLAAMERSGGAARGGTRIPEDLASLPASEAEALLRSLYGEKRYDDALRVADELLRRTDLSPEQRVELEMQGGYALRGLGKHTDAEARFRESRRRIGEGSEQAPWLGFQAAWELKYQKDSAGASREMEASANHPAVSPIVRAHSLYNAGTFARDAGDMDRARVLLRRLVDDHAGDIPPSQKFMLDQAKSILQE